MKAWRFFFFFALLLTPLLGLPQSASADTGFAIEDVGFQYKFADKLQISASIQAVEKLQTLTLLIEAEQQELRQFQITPGEQIDASIDLSTNSFVPFSRIYFWFKAELSDGTIVTSPSYWFDYSDNRFEWKNDSSKLFHIYWVNGDASYGQEVQQVARSGLERATQLLPVVPNIPIEVYVYPDEATLQSVMNLAAQSWINGHTYLEANRVLVAETNSLDDTTDIERTIPHELMHLLQFQITGQNYAKAPVWLLEGLATQSELYANADRQRLLEEALQKGTLQPLADLCVAMPQEANQVSLSYAQSASVVSYLQNQYGNQVLLAMLQNAANGLECEANISAVLGVSAQQLDSTWKNSLVESTGSTNTADLGRILWIAIPTLLVLAGVMILLRRRKHSRMHQDENGNAA